VCDIANVRDGNSQPLATDLESF